MFNNQFIFWMTFILFFFIIICILLFNINLSTLQNNIENFETSNNQTNKISIVDSYDALEITKILENARIKGKYLNVFEKKEQGQFKPLGQLCLQTDEPINSLDEYLLNKKPLTLLAKNGVSPSTYSKLWDSSSILKYDGDDFSVWRAVAPINYTCLSDIIVKGLETPTDNHIVCIPNRLLENVGYGPQVWSNYDSLNNFVNCKHIGNHNFFYCSTNNNSEIPHNIKQLKEDTILNAGEYNTNNTKVSINLSSQ
jgi:hypothetical protein